MFVSALWIAAETMVMTLSDASTLRTKHKNITHLLTHSHALQPMQGLGQFKKSPPTISLLGLALPISDSQPLCIPHHSIHPSKVWPSHLPSALRLVQGDFLHGRLSCIRTICSAHLSLVILTVVTKPVSSYRWYSSSLYLDPHVAPSQIGP